MCVILLKNLRGLRKQEEATAIFSSNCSLQSNEDLRSHLYMKFVFYKLYSQEPQTVNTYLSFSGWAAKLTLQHVSCGTTVSHEKEWAQQPGWLCREPRECKTSVQKACMVYLHNTLEMKKYRTGDRLGDARAEGEAGGAALRGHQGGFLGRWSAASRRHHGTVQAVMLP